MQNILIASENYTELDDYFVRSGAKTVLLVCGGSIKLLRLNGYFNTLEERTGIRVVRFCDFQPNPLYESAVKGVKVFRRNNCDLVAAVGGGSAMDIAKCIKLYSNMDDSENYLKQKIIPNGVPLLAVPTTAGTGSEATRYAVIYFNGEKQSVSDNSCIPSTVLFDPTTLTTLPVYQKKATMMDAFCHAIESFWSVNSTDESKAYSKEAIGLIIANKEKYIANDDEGNTNMLKAANIAGKAINITQTTAGHAMCYKLTSLYGIAHGHAAALCIVKLLPYMIKNADKCIDSRGSDHLKTVLDEIAEAMGGKTPQQAAKKLEAIVSELGLQAPAVKSSDDISLLKNSVNPIRLKNYPVALEADAIEGIYREILNA